MRKLAFSMYENKDADQLRSNAAADQRLLFSLHIIVLSTYSVILLHSKSKFQASKSSHLL